MGDVSSGMASTVVQVYIRYILESFIHPDVTARHAAIKVISLILAQGLVHPVQIVPYLICVATDPEQKLAHTADRELQVKKKLVPVFLTYYLGRNQVELFQELNTLTEKILRN